MKINLGRLIAGLGIVLGVCALIVVGSVLRFRGSDQICRGVRVAGIDVGGMSKAQASDIVQNWAKKQANRKITLVALDRRWSGSQADMGVRVDWPASINKAFAVGRGPFLSSTICVLTPNGGCKTITPQYLVDPSRLQKTLHKVAGVVNAPHKDATLRVVDSHLQIQQDNIGLKLDEEASLAAVSQAVKKGENLIRLSVVPDPPDVTAKDAASIDTLLASFSTPFNKGKVARTHNLTLASNAINGIILKPGGVFSYNDSVGPRLVGRGYRSAQIFVRGKLEDGIGGGICQVSSTLFNAALMAGMTIIERSPHSQVVPYVAPGRDATVAYGYTDFRFENSAKNPIGIITSIEGSRLVVRLYGSASDKKEVTVTTNVLKRSSAGTKTVVDESLPEGQKKVIEQGAGGLQIVLYRKLKRIDGSDIIDTFKSTYRAQTTLYAVGPTPQTAAE